MASLAGSSRRGIFKVKFFDYPGQTLLVKWKDLQDVTALEIWQPSTHDGKLSPVLFGHPCSMESKCNFLDEALVVLFQATNLHRCFTSSWIIT
jgi:hypothetical protein